MTDNIIDELQWRGAINQMTDEEGLRKATSDNHKIKLYAGVDPTGDSLHVGHLIPFIILKRFQMMGHKPVIVIGGGTGSIGDPSGKNFERVLQTAEQVHHNEEALTKQLVNLFGTENFEVLNNKDWLGKISMLDFMREYGKLFNINTMLAKDIVARRLEVGISFTEFSYQILQSIDFLKLNQEHDVALQIGGADQWGNITSGTDLIHRLTGGEAEAYGLTIPLMLKSDGTKFGKTAGGAVWLDPEKTSPYEFYQFWFNQTDEDVLKYLKYFTFLDQAEIDDLGKQMAENPGKRAAQKKLAEEVTRFVHGQANLEKAQKITESLFKGAIDQLTFEELQLALAQVKSFEISAKTVNVIDFLVDETDIEPSRKRAREDVQGGAISINGEKVKDIDYEINPKDQFDGKAVVARRGKKNYFVAYVK